MEIPKFTKIYKISQLVPNDLFCYFHFRYEEKRLIFFDDVFSIFILFVIHMLILAI